MKLTTKITGNGKQGTGSRLRIGGMAMENGILFQTDRNWTMGIRDEYGRVRVVSGRKIGLDRSSPLKRIPMLRGLVNMAETVILLPRVYSQGGRLPIPTNSPEVLASTIVSVVGTMILKNPKKRFPPVIEELLVSALTVIPSLVALRKTHATQYHAAEHKSINAYEHSGRLDSADARSARSEHARCGSNVIGPALALMTLGNLLTRSFFGRQSPAARIGVSFLSLSGAIEMIQWASRHPASPWAKLFTSPGHNLQQKVTTTEPTDEQLAVGLAALGELLHLEGARAPDAPGDPAPGLG